MAVYLQGKAGQVGPEDIDLSIHWDINKIIAQVWQPNNSRLRKLQLIKPNPVYMEYT